MEKVIFTIGIIFAASCGDHNKAAYAEATRVAAVAATAQVVQAAKSRSQNQSPNPNLNPDAGVSSHSSDETCCASCPKGTFPCGNECWPVGVLPPCLDPPGCACYEGAEPDVMPEENPAAVPPPPALSIPSNAH